MSEEVGKEGEATESREVVESRVEGGHAIARVKAIREIMRPCVKTWAKWALSRPKSTVPATSTSKPKKLPKYKTLSPA